MNSSDEIVIEFQNVSKSYPGINALIDVSFNVRRGRVHGFLGPNGAGKTTSMSILSGLIPPSSGDVKILGESVVSSPFKAREKIGFLPENPPLYDAMRVRSYLEFVCEIHSVRSKDVDKKKIKAQVDKVLDRCGLVNVEKRLIGNLSKGYRQRVGIAQAIVFDPEIIIFDEPTNGLDPDAIVEIRKLTLELGREKTVLFSSHILSEVELMSDDITIIRNGQISRSGTLEEIQNSFQVNRVIKAEVGSISNELVDKLKEKFKTEKLEINKSEKHTELKIFLPQSLGDQRSNVSLFLAQNNCGLLSFSEYRPQLEDIFHQTTGQDSKSEFKHA